MHRKEERERDVEKDTKRQKSEVKTQRGRKKERDVCFKTHRRGRRG